MTTISFATDIPGHDDDTVIEGVVVDVYVKALAAITGDVEAPAEIRVDRRAGLVSCWSIDEAGWQYSFTTVAWSQVRDAVRAMS